ncbi:MAG: hypothetical protein V4739_17270 [Pseudomonadota bacterium]
MTVTAASTRKHPTPSARGETPAAPPFGFEQATRYVSAGIASLPSHPPTARTTATFKAGIPAGAVVATREQLKAGWQRTRATVRVDDRTLDRVIALYGQRGQGNLSAPELQAAIDDGVVKVDDAAGAVTVDALALQKRLPALVPQFMLRVVRAGSSDDGYATVAEMEAGMKAAGLDLRHLKAGDLAWLVKTYHTPTVDGLCADELVSAFRDGAIQINPGGWITVDRRAPQAAADAAQGTGDAATAEKAPGFFTAFSLPNPPTQQDIDRLTADIRRHGKEDAGRSPTGLVLSDPRTFTKFQKSAFTALNSLEPEVLARHPELTEALREHAQTDGFLELQGATHANYATIVGDYSRVPNNGDLHAATRIMNPEALLDYCFDTSEAGDARIPRFIESWIYDNQQDTAGAKRLQALLRTGRLRVVHEDIGGPSSVTVSPYTLQVTVRGRLDALLLEEELTQAMDELVASPTGFDAFLAELNATEVEDRGLKLVEEAYEFSEGFDPEVKQMLVALADGSPTFRNTLMRAISLHRKIKVSLKDQMPSSGHTFRRDGTQMIEVRQASNEKMASIITFETCNAAMDNVLAHSDKLRLPDVWGATDESMDRMAVMAYKSYLLRWSPTDRTDFLAWVHQVQDGQSRSTFNESQLSPEHVEAQMTAGNIESYLNARYGRFSHPLEKIRPAMAWEMAEINSEVLFGHIDHEFLKAVHSEAALLAEDGPTFLTALSDTMDGLRFKGNVRDHWLTASLSNGHTGQYMVQLMRLEQANAGRVRFFYSEPEPGLAAADTSHETAHASGRRSRDALDGAAEKHGVGGQAQVQALAEAEIDKESERFVTAFLQHPRTAKFLQGAGIVMVGFQAAELRTQLIAAYRQDLLNGDLEMHAFRRVLVREVSGFVEGAVAGTEGAEWGAGIGAALGTALLPGVGTMVGAFLGGLLGGVVAGTAGYELGRAEGGVLASMGQRPVDALLSHLFPGIDKGRQGPAALTPEAFGRRIVLAGSGDDDRVSAPEFLRGLKRAGYQPVISLQEAERLVSVFGAAGDGSCTAAELTEAVYAGALRIDAATGVVSFDTLAASHTMAQMEAAAPQGGDALPHAGAGNDAARTHLASRLLHLAGPALDAGQLRTALTAAGWSVDGVGHLPALVHRHDLDGSGALEGDEVLAALQELGFTADGAVVASAAPRTADASLPRPLQVGQLVVQAGTGGGGSQVDAQGLIKGLEGMGFEVPFDAWAARRLVVGFDSDGDGKLSAQDIAAAVQACALVESDGVAGIRIEALVHTPAHLGWQRDPGFGVGFSRAGHDGFAAHTAAYLASTSPRRDGHLNTVELRIGLLGAGWEHDFTDEALAVAMQRHDADGSRTLDAAELEDFVTTELDFKTNGHVGLKVV